MPWWVRVSTNRRDEKAQAHEASSAPAVVVVVTESALQTDFHHSWPRFVVAAAVVGLVAEGVAEAYSEKTTRSSVPSVDDVA